jgi:spore germination protein YaaH
MKRLTTILAAGAALTALGPASLPAGAAAAPAATTTAAAASASASASAKRCATSARSITFTRKARSKYGRVAWKAPKAARGKARLVYRVSVNGRRVTQTRAHSARFRVKLHKRYRVTVASVRNGRADRARCRPARTITVKVLPPSAPKRLTATVAGGQAQLHWQPSRPGDGRFAGYRVFRDGRTVKQVAGTTYAVPVSASRSATLSVRGVDSAGRMSAAASTTVTGPSGSGASAPAKAPAPSGAPSAPTNLRGLVVTDSSVSLMWDASTAPAGSRVVGYRVFRDGVALGQTAETRMDVPRLATVQTYTFTVVAVDGQGRTSEPSAPLTVTTNPPPPSTGGLHAFLLASTDSSFEDFRNHYTKIAAIHPTYFQCNRSTAAVEGADNPQITQFAKLRHVQVFARFDCQSTATLNTILNDPGVRATWLQTITDTAINNGYDGINLDFEAGAAANRAAMSSFVADLASRLHAAGKKLAVDVSAKAADVQNHPRSTFYDYNALSASADIVFVMNWGIHWATSGPGPIADMPWVQNVVAYVNSLPNRQKFVMGAPMYGMDWANGGGAANPATALEWADITGLAAGVGATPRFDPAAREVTFDYTAADGTPHTVWGLDSAAVLERLRLYAANGYGIGVWRLGREDQALWNDPVLGG